MQGLTNVKTVKKREMNGLRGYTEWKRRFPKRNVAQIATLASLKRVTQMGLGTREKQLHDVCFFIVCLWPEVGGRTRAQYGCAGFLAGGREIRIGHSTAESRFFARLFTTTGC